jgi:hypothetical protein
MLTALSDSRRDEIMSDLERKTGRGTGAVWKFLLFLMIVAVVMGTWATYQYGAEWNVSINGRGIDELQPWEVVGGVVIGLVGLVVGLIGGAIGLIIGLLAAALAIMLAVLGIAAGVFFTAGFFLGPFLLLAAIILLIRRRTHPETI